MAKPVHAVASGRRNSARNSTGTTLRVSQGACVSYFRTALPEWSRPLRKMPVSGIRDGWAVPPRRKPSTKKRCAWLWLPTSARSGPLTTNCSLRVVTVTKLAEESMKTFVQDQAEAGRRIAAKPAPGVVIAKGAYGQWTKPLARQWCFDTSLKVVEGVWLCFLC
jgi:hypothetical protein